jgi:hypothetical protein
MTITPEDAKRLRGSYRPIYMDADQQAYREYYEKYGDNHGNAGQVATRLAGIEGAGEGESQDRPERNVLQEFFNTGPADNRPEVVRQRRIDQLESRLSPVTNTDRAAAQDVKSVSDEGGLGAAFLQGAGRGATLSTRLMARGASDYDNQTDPNLLYALERLTDANASKGTGHMIASGLGEAVGGFADPAQLALAGGVGAGLGAAARAGGALARPVVRGAAAGAVEGSLTTAAEMGTTPGDFTNQQRLGMAAKGGAVGAGFGAVAGGGLTALGRGVAKGTGRLGDEGVFGRDIPDMRPIDPRTLPNRKTGEPAGDGENLTYDEDLAKADEFVQMVNRSQRQANRILADTEPSPLESRVFAETGRTAKGILNIAEEAARQGIPRRVAVRDARSGLTVDEIVAKNSEYLEPEVGARIQVPPNQVPGSEGLRRFEARSAKQGVADNPRLEQRRRVGDDILSRMETQNAGGRVLGEPDRIAADRAEALRDPDIMDEVESLVEAGFSRADAERVALPEFEPPSKPQVKGASGEQEQLFPLYSGLGPDILDNAIRQAVDTGKWVKGHADIAARWLGETLGPKIKNMSQAAKALIERFGRPIRQHVRAIWDRFTALTSRIMGDKQGGGIRSRVSNEPSMGERFAEGYERGGVVGGVAEASRALSPRQLAKETRDIVDGFRQGGLREASRRAMQLRNQPEVFESATPVSEETISDLVRAIRKAKPVLNVRKLAISRERAKRAGRLQGIQDRSNPRDLTDSARIFRKVMASGDEGYAPKSAFEPFRNLLSDKQMVELNEHIMGHKMFDGKPIKQ